MGLPAASLAKGPESEAAAAPSARAVAAVRRRVLAVDDDAQMLTLYRRIFSRLHQVMEGVAFDCEFCETRAELEAGLAQGPPPDLVFMDLRLPGELEDGFALTNRLWQRFPETHVIICSGELLTFSTLRERLGDSDRYLFLRKPFDAPEVLQLAANIHAKLLAREQLARTLEGLEHEVELRTRDLRLTNELLQAEIAARKQVELELRHAQKVEAMGRLAAGIAHEINTPMQFVGDNLAFVRHAWRDLLTLLDTCQEIAPAEVARLEEELDLAYLREHLPLAVSGATEGVRRVSEIVQAMKSFAHSGQAEKTPADLNEAIHHTLIVARSEYQPVADVEFDLQELPEVLCNVSDVNQVLLNLVVNAARAIEPKFLASGQRGRISVSSTLEGEQVVVRVRDSGTGIDEAIRDKIFEPFFTTREVGEGTGQGLAIARTIAVQGHGGSLDFVSEPGQGTTFELRLPMGGAP